MFSKELGPSPANSITGSNEQFDINQTQPNISTKQENKASFVILNLLADSQSEWSNDTAVRLSEKDMKKIYPDGYEKTSYIQISNQIFRAKVISSKQMKGQILLNPDQLLVLGKTTSSGSSSLDSAQNKVVVYPARKNEIITHKISKVDFDLTLAQTRSAVSRGGALKVYSNEITKFLKKKLSKEFLCEGRRYSFQTPQGIFNIVVKNLNFATDQSSDLKKISNFGKEVHLFGKIDKKHTEISFKLPNTFPSSDIMIMEKAVSDEEIEKLYFEVELTASKVNKKRARVDLPPVILIQKRSIEEALAEHYNNKSLTLNQGFEIVESGRSFLVHLKSVKLNAAHGGSVINDISVNQEFAFNSKKINLGWLSKDICVVEGDPYQTDEIELAIVKQEDTGHSKNWINLEKLEKKLQSMELLLVPGQHFYIDVGHQKYLMKVKEAKGEGTSARIQLSAGKSSDISQPNGVPAMNDGLKLGISLTNDGLKQTTSCSEISRPWKITGSTRVTIDEKENANLKLMRDGSANSIAKVVIDVTSSGSDISQMPVIAREKLKDLVRKSLNKKVFCGFSSIKESQKHELKFKIKELYFKDGSSDKIGKGPFRALGRLDETSEIEFATTGELKLVEDAEQYNIYKNVNDFATNLKIGGMSEQIKDLIRRIYFSRGSLRNHYRDLELTPVRGMLLYGPPGTGKTTLARNLGKLLGVDSNNIVQFSGTEVLNMYVGGSEDNLREKFGAARKDHNLYGEKSPLHLIIIDEIDSIAPYRDRAGDPHTAKLTNELLTQIDGLGQLNNILVVGITNRLDHLDEAVIRPGRLEWQVEIGLPDKQGREEIFKIHTRTIAKKNCLGNDVDFAQLAERIGDVSGAIIEGLVKEAISYSLERLNELIAKKPELSNDLDHDFSQYSEAAITMADFNKACEKLLPKEDSSIHLTMYN
ncbi:MAG: nsfA [Chlamydiales bacterium]|jgi:SpoVK/Ycf46/Vps4 family AAA+-type ATPase|nr:nsfA [Chlamydiales bacterium]